MGGGGEKDVKYNLNTYIVESLVNKVIKILVKTSLKIQISQNRG